jgi:putative sigma-54 modulation protein
MDVQVKTRGIRLTDGLQEYVRKRVQKLDRINENVLDAKLELRSEKNRTGGEQLVAQLTIQTKNAILRSEEKNHDLHTAIDLSIDRMERQIKRFHDKKVFARRRVRAEEELAVSAQNGQSDVALADLEDDERPVLVRHKRFKIQPLSEEEAIEQMELLGHDFFVFFNPDEGQINVLYRRRNGEYGIIQPDIA